MKVAIFVGALLASHASGEVTDAAANAINEFGLDLYGRLAKPGENLCVSPLSIQNALAMAYAGADGVTREEMARVLRYPIGDGIHDSFAAVNGALTEIQARSAKWAAELKGRGVAFDPLSLNVVNRLYGQAGYDFSQPFLARLDGTYHATMGILDFQKNPEDARTRINSWVEERTQRRMRNLLPKGAITKDTRLVLVNAVHLKARWFQEFRAEATKPEPFHVNGGRAKPVMTMIGLAGGSLARRSGITAVRLPFADTELQFVVLIPDKMNGLAELEKNLTAETLAGLSKEQGPGTRLHLPKFRIEGKGIELHELLGAMGMRSAFDQPKGSADFGKIAPRKPDDYLFLSNVIHKAFISVEERGVEAAAAAVSPGVVGGDPLEMKVNRPFLFAIQHAPSGACLFLGRVTNPLSD
ncbi:MAG: serpin family protein [Chthoniobacteraceae bacterium]